MKFRAFNEISTCDSIRMNSIETLDSFQSLDKENLMFTKAMRLMELKSL